MKVTDYQLIEILVKATNKDTLLNMDPNSLIKEQGLDSLDLIVFFFDIEKAFNIKISTIEQQKLTTINSIKEFLNNRD
jgi:acyl carrier protein